MTVLLQRVQLINQGYSPYVKEALPSVHRLNRVSDDICTMYWSVTDKRYIIFSHMQIHGPVKYRLTSVKKSNVFIP